MDGLRKDLYTDGATAPSAAIIGAVVAPNSPSEGRRYHQAAPSLDFFREGGHDEGGA